MRSWLCISAIRSSSRSSDAPSFFDRGVPDDRVGAEDPPPPLPGTGGRSRTADRNLDRTPKHRGGTDAVGLYRVMPVQL